MKRFDRELCEECQKIALRYLTYTSDSDRELQMIADLCIGTGEGHDLSWNSLAEVGSYINQYLHKKSISHRFFFGTEHDCLDDALVESEFVMLDRRNKN